LVDGVVEVDKKDSVLWDRQVRELKDRTYNHIVCPHESIRTAKLVYGLKANGFKIGFHRAWNFFAFDRRVHRPNNLPDSLRQLALLTSLDPGFAEEFSEVSGNEALHNPETKSGPVDFRSIAIPDWADMGVSPPELNEDTLKWIPGLKERLHWPGILVAPGSVWATKRWTQHGFTELARRLVGRGYDVVLIGSEQERPLCEEIHHEVPATLVAAGKTSLTQTAALMAKSLALISNDSGAMHLAATVKLPTVSLFGPTTLSIGYRPWQQKSIVVQKDLSCRPCGKHGSDRCPIGTHQCMRDISVDQVLSALNDLL